MSLAICKLVHDACMQGLSQYGNGFLAKFEAAACPNQLLEEVTLVDTPGVLSGEKQRIEVRFTQRPSFHLDFLEIMLMCREIST